MTTAFAMDLDDLDDTPPEPPRRPPGYSVDHEIGVCTYETTTYDGYVIRTEGPLEEPEPRLAAFHRGRVRRYLLATNSRRLRPPGARRFPR